MGARVEVSGQDFATAFYPIEMVRALVGVWLLGGCRIDEIYRLEPDCIIWNQAHDADTGEEFTAYLPRSPALADFCP